MLKLISKDTRAGKELKFKKINYIDRFCFGLAAVVIIINILILFLI